MKLVYDPEVDVLSVLLSDAPVVESDQDKPGVIQGSPTEKEKTKWHWARLPALHYGFRL